MPRNDAILYTGQTSAIRRRERIEAQRAMLAKTKAKIEPKAIDFLDLIEQEQEATLKTLLSMVNSSTPEADVKSMIVSLNLYKQSLSSLKSKVNNILRHAIYEPEGIDE